VAIETEKSAFCDLGNQYLRRAPPAGSDIQGEGFAGRIEVMEG
jgi:hypothetical protein